jgi:hypothetical protein
MTFEIITKQDLKDLKKDIIKEISLILEGKTEKKEWLKSSEVKEMLGISDGTLQNLRINGTLPHTKIGGTIYYEYVDVVAILKINKTKVA